MADPTLFTTVYAHQEGAVSWCGVSMEDDSEFATFMTGDVASRLHDAEGAAEFATFARGLADTGFARENLEAIFGAAVPEERDWAVGEAMAEAFLAREHGICWPWNMERDKRNPRASLQGADLVGFKIDGANVRLALGEVKTSSQKKSPPGVMNGRSGMKHQIDKLASNLGLAYQLLMWLFFRCKDTEHEEALKTAIKQYLNLGRKAVSLYGVLVRDTDPDVMDLQGRGQVLAKSTEDPTSCDLIAIHVPCKISDLPERVSAGDA